MSEIEDVTKGDDQATCNLVASPNQNGKDEKGRFVKGNKGGPGNPTHQIISRWRRVLAKKCTNETLRKVWKALVEKAESGDVAACKEVLDRTIGKGATILGEQERSAITIQVLNLMQSPAAFTLANDLAKQLALQERTRLVDANIVGPSCDGSQEDESDPADPRQQDEGDEPGG